MARQKYDVFISYRRDGGEAFCTLLHDRLTAMGYRVFQDVESLNPGPFNTQLLEVIEQCTDFIVVCSKGSMERCKNEGDWVRREIAHALGLDSSGTPRLDDNGQPVPPKNIIPVLFRDFHWNDHPLPEEIAPLADYAGVEALSTELFPAAIERLAKRFMKSTNWKEVEREEKEAAEKEAARKKKLRKLVTWATAGVLLMAASVVGIIAGMKYLPELVNPASLDMLDLDQRIPEGVSAFVPNGIAKITMKSGKTYNAYANTLLSTSGGTVGRGLIGRGSGVIGYDETKKITMKPVLDEAGDLFLLSVSLKEVEGNRLAYDLDPYDNKLSFLDTQGGQYSRTVDLADVKKVEFRWHQVPPSIKEYMRIDFKEGISVAVPKNLIFTYRYWQQGRYKQEFALQFESGASIPFNQIKHLEIVNSYRAKPDYTDMELDHYVLKALLSSDMEMTGEVADSYVYPNYWPYAFYAVSDLGTYGVLEIVLNSLESMEAIEN